MHTLKAAAIAAIAAGLFIAAQPAYAITGSEYTARTPTEQTAYSIGIADMAAQLFIRMGDPERADCIIRWLETADSVKDVDFAMQKNPNIQAAAVMEALMKKRCGEYK
ncbi:hypothetical protein [Arvimicrobium flavum]|uniref:hypothetical protein n=1 Tax=Arvimicrobium flavum TaxID=3393320 RepID=UPI00237B7499|nr:hypothetical protein [Mesorhizobium shangrilense]